MDDVDRVRRWVDSGGTVKVLRSGGSGGSDVLLALCTCDGGEEQGRAQVTAAQAHEFVDPEGRAGDRELGNDSEESDR